MQDLISIVKKTCAGCGSPVREYDSAFVVRGDQTQNVTPAIVCYSCSLKTEEIFVYSRKQGPKNLVHSWTIPETENASDSHRITEIATGSQKLDFDVLW